MYVYVDFYLLQASVIINKLPAQDSQTVSFQVSVVEIGKCAFSLQMVFEPANDGPNVDQDGEFGEDENGMNLTQQIPPQGNTDSDGPQLLRLLPYTLPLTEFMRPMGE